MKPTIAAVSYLNSRPLIEGLAGRQDISLFKGVPSALVSRLETGEASLALCPVVDYQRSSEELVLVPVGAIGSRARTMTVRVFSRKDIGGLKSIHVDGESHTSIALLRVILAEVYGSHPALHPLERNALGEIPQDVDAALLIGDKVVTEEPPAEDFPEQLDLGEAWRELTDLPFVFAMWMARPGVSLGELPELLRTQLAENLARIGEYLPGWAAEHGWPLPEAREYLVDLLDYSAGPLQLEAIELFWKKCRQHEVISNLKEMRLIG